MFNKFLKPRWKSENPVHRLDAVRGFDSKNPEQMAILKKLALSDSADEVRSTAMQSISDYQWLSDLLSSNLPETVNGEVRQRIQAILSNENSDSIETINTYIDSTDEPEMLIDIACHSAVQPIREKAVLKIHSDEVLNKVIAISRFHDTRLIAANQLNAIGFVETAWRSIKNRDKVVARKLQDRLQKYKAEEKINRELEERVDHLLASMQSLAKNQWSSSFYGRFLSIKQRWEKLEIDISSDRQNHFLQAEKAVSEIIGQHRKIEETHKTQSDMVQKLVDLHLQAMELNKKDLQSGISEIVTSIAESDRRWKQSVSVQSPEKILSQKYHRCYEQIDKVLKLGNKVVSILDSIDSETPLPVGTISEKLGRIDRVLSEYKDKKSDEKPLFVKQLVENADDLRRSIKAVESEIQSNIQAIDKQFRSLHSVLTAGDWSAANSIYQRLPARLDKLDKFDRKRFESRLSKAKERLHEIGDWKSFATAPKLEGLCQKMEAVPEMNLNPRDRADLIKKLQHEWKAIGSSPESNNLWPRFKEASDKSYAPCAEYFGEQRQQRDQNLEERRDICQQLQKYLDSNNWDKPNWKLVEKTQRIAKQAWRQTRVVDRKANRPLEEQFTGLMQGFDERLNAEYAKNAAAKQELIDKISVFADGEINQHILNQVKQLQTVWKQAGIMRRKEDQALWERFNKICRHIFDANRQIEKQKYEKTIAHVREARIFLKEMLALIGKDELDEKVFTTLQDNFQALPEFPAKDKKNLEREYQKIAELFEQQRIRIQEGAEKARFDDLRRRSEICDQLDQILFSMPNDIDQQLESLHSQWEQCGKDQKKHWLQAVTRRYVTILDHIQSHTKPDYAAANHDRRILCIELEILADVETPEGDKALRMEYQLERLQQGKKAGMAKQLYDLLLDLELRWLCADGATAEVAPGLKDRFNKTLAKAKA